jgi:hypothetical protein
VERREKAAHELGTGVGDQHEAADLLREQRLSNDGGRLVSLLRRAPRPPEPARLEQIDDGVSDLSLGQPARRRQHLAELVGADGDERDLRAAGRVSGPVEPQASVGENAGGFVSREQVGDVVRLGHHHRPDLSAGLVDASGHGVRGVEIGGKDDPRDRRQLSQERLGQAGMLMRLLVLAVLPGVGGEDQRDREPARGPFRHLAVGGEDDFLAAPWISRRARPRARPTADSRSACVASARTEPVGTRSTVTTQRRSAPPRGPLMSESATPTDETRVAIGPSAARVRFSRWRWMAPSRL